MSDRRPRVSIGLPVFEGEPFLAAAIDSILAQTFGDFELILSDNASSDGTEEICRRYAARDRRVRYHRYAANVGASRNFNRVFALSSGKYFKWAAHDDLLAPDFLRSCVRVLDEDPSVALAFSRMGIVDESGKLIKEDLPLRPTGVDAPRPASRFRRLVTDRHGCFHFWGLIRSDVLDRTPLMGSYIACDRALLAEIALHGRFHAVDASLFFLRHHCRRSVKAFPFYERGPWYDPELRGRVTFPTWRLLGEYGSSVRRTPLRPGDRLRCRLALLQWIFRGWNGAKLAMDLVVAAAPGASRVHVAAKEWRDRRRTRLAHG